MFSTEKKKRKTGWWVFLLVLVVIFVGFRLYLPTAAKNHVNKVLNDLPGYQGSVDDIDIALIRGAYVVTNLRLRRRDAKTDVPFLNIPQADISIQWRALFNGKIVSEIYLTEPQLIYVFEDQLQQGQQEPETKDWTEALDDLVPIDINHLNIENGRLGLVKVNANPMLDIYMDQLQLTADNLQLVKSDEQNLPSPVKAAAVTIGRGQTELEGRVNFIKDIPDMDVSLSIKDIDVTALNSFTLHYANVDFTSGQLDLYSEVAVADGYLKGYFKPLLTDAKLIDQGDGFFKKLWEGVVGVFKFIFKNQSTDKVATKIPFEGNLDNVEAGVWQTFVNILKNAWVKAFQDNIDEDIEFSDVQKEADAQEAEQPEDGS
ncbi:DUF748 domain-containing protein [Marinicella pacifica]|nr:DUF748 domain-containing protein [Marinicella pacifica]